MLFDLDMGLANADIVLGVESNGTLSDVLSGRRTLEDVTIQAPGEITFVPGASGIAGLADLSEFERYQLLTTLQQVDEQYEVIILDCGAGISKNVLTFGSVADTLLIVSTPEPTAITDAYATMKAFVLERDELNRSTDDPLAAMGVIVNQSESRHEGKQVYERLAGVAAKFLHVPVTDYGYILRDEHVPAAIRSRTPLLLKYPRCSASACLLSTAARLSADLGKPTTGETFFTRVMRMFL
jgi:flagellar biosynthesis protein FlhG